MRLIKRERGGAAGIETGTIPASNNRDLTKAKKAAGTGGTASQSSVTHKSIHKIPAMLSIPAATKLSGPDFVHISTPRKFWTHKRDRPSRNSTKAIPAAQSITNIQSIRRVQ
jgi:hypothetical protein